MKKIFVILSFLLCIGAKNYAQNVNIPDSGFKSYLVNNAAINTNGDSEIQVSEANAFTGTIDVSFYGISDLTGIEAFTQLIGIDCSNNQLTSLDISNNTALLYLYVANNQLTSLNITNNIYLQEINCQNNQLSSIDVTNKPNLYSLSFGNNQISSVDVSNNPALQNLWCQNTQINTLNLTNNSILVNLQCQNNQLSSLDLHYNIQLVELRCQNNPNLSCIQVWDTTFANTNFTVANSSIDATMHFSLDCFGLNVAIPDPEFKTWLISDPAIDVNGDGQIQITEATAYTGAVYAVSSGIADLTGIEAFTGITSLYCQDNQLTQLDISNNTALINFKCINNPNLSCIQVWDTSYANANFTVIDSSIDATMHFSLDCSGSSITIPNANFRTALINNPNINTNGDNEIQISEANAYTGAIDVSNLGINNLTGIAAFTAITSLDCSNNQLSQLDISNNTALINFRCTNNPNLSCIQVWDVAYANTNWTAANSSIDPNMSFSLDCNYVSTAENLASSLSILPNPASDYLYISYKGEKKVSFAISDIWGKTLAAWETTSAGAFYQKEVPISAFSAGIYFLSAQAGDKKVVKKFVKE